MDGVVHFLFVLLSTTLEPTLSAEFLQTESEYFIKFETKEESQKVEGKDWS